MSIPLSTFLGRHRFKTAVAVLLTASMFLLWELVMKTKTERLYSYLGDDFPESMPLSSLGQVKMTVEESVHYPLDGPEAIYDWASNNPQGYGYLRLGENRRMLCLSMGHQLHCLRLLRIAMTDPDDPLSSVYHSQHCLNYLRQMTLCHPDLTLEPFDPLSRDFELERVGATHVCRDWRAVYDMLAQNWDGWKEYKNMTGVY